MVAHPDGAHVLENRPARFTLVRRVLARVLFLNLGVALVKIALGSATGAISILSDGFHSLTDTGSNVVALIGISVARRPPDDNHPYGHRKYETMASIGIVVFLLLVLVEVVRAALNRLWRDGRVPEVSVSGIGLMLLTLAVNVGVVWYETREGRRLASDVLLADAHHTRSDVLTTGAVLLALFGVWLGYPLLDPVAALLVAMFILYACWQIVQGASRILSDEIVIAEEEVRQIVQQVRGVLGCEKIRTRGTADYVFMDLHVWADGNTTLSEAHRTSHIVKDALMDKFPHLADVVIHIEPPPADPRSSNAGRPSR